MRILAPLAALALAGCATPSPAANDFAVTLERSVCFGACPDYSVTVSGDGRVRYEGRRFVAVTGMREDRIAPAAAQALRARFEQARFFALKDEYAAQVTDLPTYRLTLVLGGRSKTVRDYGGRMAGMPPVVTELEKAVDETAGTASWVGSR